MNNIGDKVEEARYFLSRLTNASRDAQDLRDLQYNLRAFLSAARSSLFMVRKQYGRSPGFREWLREVEADPHIRFLRELRDQDIHESPFTPGFEVKAWSGERSIRRLADGAVVLKYRPERVEWSWTFDRYPGLDVDGDEDDYAAEYESEHGELPSKDVVMVCGEVLGAIEGVAHEARRTWPA